MSEMNRRANDEEQAFRRQMEQEKRTRSAARTPAAQGRQREMDEMYARFDREGTIDLDDPRPRGRSASKQKAPEMATEMAADLERKASKTNT